MSAAAAEVAGGVADVVLDNIIGVPLDPNLRVKRQTAEQISKRHRCGGSNSVQIQGV
jgi:hypothetical protein